MFTRHYSPVLAYARRRVPHEAGDVVGEVFLTAWRRLDELPDGDAVRVWLYATARRVIANQRGRIPAARLRKPCDGTRSALRPAPREARKPRPRRRNEECENDQRDREPGDGDG